MRGKKRPAVIVQSDRYAGIVSSLFVAEITTNLSMANDPACLLIDPNSSEGLNTGIVRDLVVSCLMVVTVYSDRVERVPGELSTGMLQKLDACLKAAFALS